MIYIFPKVVDLIGDHWIEGGFYPEAILEREETYYPLTGHIYGTWQIVEKDNTRKLRNYSIRVYTCDEFRQLYEQTGFKKIRFVGDWKEQFQPQIHEELIVVGEK